MTDAKPIQPFSTGSWGMQRLVRAKPVCCPQGYWYFHRQDLWISGSPIRQFYSNKHWGQWVEHPDPVVEFHHNNLCSDNLVLVARRLTEDIRRMTSVLKFYEVILFDCEEAPTGPWVRLVPFVTLVNEPPFDQKILRTRVLYGSDPQMGLSKFLRTLARHGQDPKWIHELEQSQVRKVVFLS